MVNNENIVNLINNKKSVELVQELKDYEIKKSPLSVAARGKVISKSGSDYVSENKGGYGPVIWSGCDKSSSSYSDYRDKKKCPRGCGVWIDDYRSHCGSRSCMTEEERIKEFKNAKVALGSTLTVASFLFPPAAVVGLTTFFGATGATMFVAGEVKGDKELTASGSAFLEATGEEIGKGIGRAARKAIFKK